MIVLYLIKGDILTSNHHPNSLILELGVVTKYGSIVKCKFNMLLHFSSRLFFYHVEYINMVVINKP